MSDEVLVEIGFDELEELFNEAEQLLEQATSFAQIGKFHSFTTAHTWSESEGVNEVDAKTWKAHQGFKWLTLHVNVNTQEFNPALEKQYERRIQVKSAAWNKKNDDDTYEKIPSDWFANWEPSVKNTLGSEYKNMTQALKSIEGKYVKCLDVLQQPTKRQPEPEYNTAKLVTVYESREAAMKDYQGVTGKSVESSDDNSGSKPGPTADYETWDEFAGNVRTMRSQGTTDKEIAEMLEVKIKDVLKVK